MNRNRKILVHALSNFGPGHAPDHASLIVETEEMEVFGKFRLRWEDYGYWGSKGLLQEMPWFLQAII